MHLGSSNNYKSELLLNYIVFLDHDYRILISSERLEVVMSMELD
jgi:hypothetical protein